MSRKRILVLESEWADDLSDRTSVRPFLEGWAALNEFDLSYRMYHDKATLEYWLKAFVKDECIQVCYVAGHGEGGRLCGLERDINIGPLAQATRVRSMAKLPKGILFGSCDVGGRLKEFLPTAGRTIQWVGGYEIPVPWLESTLCDLLFLEYFIKGRRKRKNGAIGTDAIQSTHSAVKALQWVQEDYPMATLCRFVVFER